MPESWDVHTNEKKLFRLYLDATENGSQGTHNTDYISTGKKLGRFASSKTLEIPRDIDNDNEAATSKI